MNRLLIYQAQDEKLFPYAQRVYEALCAEAIGIVVNKAGETLCNIFLKAIHKDWDELLLVTDDLIGPLDQGNLQRIFSTMQEKKVSCWGLTSLHISKEQPGESITSSTWLALRRDLFASDAFVQLIHEQPADIMQAICNLIVEQHATYASVIPEAASEACGGDPLLYCPYTAVVTYGCPFVDRRCFTMPHAKLLEVSMSEEPGRLLRYLEATDSEAVDAVWDSLLSGQYDLNVIANLGLLYCLPTAPPAQSVSMEKGECCLLMHLFFTELGPEALHYASQMPPSADIYITTTDEEKRAYYQRLFSVLPNRVEIRITVNRGRDMGSLLIGFRDVVRQYALCCFYHDKKSQFNSVASVGRSFAYLISESALASPGYVLRIVQQFRDHPRLGILCPVVPHHADYYGVSAHYWDHNREEAKALLHRLSISVPFPAREGLPASWGNVFWFRTKALTSLFDYPWTYEDFPPEPYPVDGCIAHALERCYFLVAQSQGYYTGLVAPDYLAGQVLMNFHSYFQEYVAVMDGAQLLGQHRATVQCVDKMVNSREARGKRWLHHRLRSILGERLMARLHGYRNGVTLEINNRRIVKNV